MTEQLRLTGGTIHDPANDIDGEVRDLCIKDGRIVADLPDDAPRKDISGMIVMPGGVDIHCHVASATTNHARRLQTEQLRQNPEKAPELLDGIGRSGSGGTVPTTFTTGYKYTALGYTTVFDAAVAPLTASLCHAALDDTPLVDAGFFTLLGNDDYLLSQLAAGQANLARDYMAWLLGRVGSYAVKIVNPGGVEWWKSGNREPREFDEPVRDGVTPRLILETLTQAANDLKLPHPVHVHCNDLGIPGNVATTLASMRAVAGRRAHFTHLQFHSYGGAKGENWFSAAAEIAEYINHHPEVTGDVGQVMFGPATTLTADGPVEYLLHATTGKPWTNLDIELETGCGIVPYTYHERNAAAALQWVVGLELFLLSEDPWRMVLSTDHPNGGSFVAYPELIELLMSRDRRQEQFERINQKYLAGSALADGISREYTLNEIAIITRAGPARILGLKNKGHLGPGADADITIYQRQERITEMFAMPRYVYKAGTLVVEEAQLRRAPQGKRLYIQPEYDDRVLKTLRQHHQKHATTRFNPNPLSSIPQKANRDINSTLNPEP